MCNILCQRTTPWGATKSRLARWLHNIVVVSMLCESHTSAAEPRVARRLFGGVRDHYLHHRLRGPPFQQFFSYLDALVPHFDAALDAFRGSGAAAKPAEAAAEARSGAAGRAAPTRVARASPRLARARARASTSPLRARGPAGGI